MRLAEPEDEEVMILAAKKKTMSVAVVRSATRRRVQCIAQTNTCMFCERGIKQGLERDSIHMAVRAKIQCCFRWCCLVGKLHPGHDHVVCS